jgi:nicotinamidase/pyrazinamidase
MKIPGLGIVPKGKIASIDIDAQNGFTPQCPDELPVCEGDQIVTELNKQAKFARYRLGSKDAHCDNAKWIATRNHPQFSTVEGFPNVDVYWTKHCVMGTFGAELIEGLPAITDYDLFVWKGIEPTMHPYGACYHDFAKKLSTGLIEFLKVHDIKVAIVGGLALDYCVKETVLELLDAGFYVVVNLAGCRSVAKTTEEPAILEMQKAGAVFVKNHQELYQN